MFNKKEKIIGEYWDSLRKIWIGFTKSDLKDSVDGHYKIEPKFYFNPDLNTIWFSPEDVIIYKDIDPFEKALKAEKKRRDK